MALPGGSKTPHLVGLMPKNTVSSRFSSQLVNRFHTSGISGSMEKHTKVVKQPEIALVEKKEKKLLASSSASLLMRKEREIAEDVIRMEALEKRLAEIREAKELRRKKEEARAQRKLMLISAVLVQKSIRRFLKRRKETNAAIILAFIKSLLARQAVTAAAWAAATISRFARLACRRWFYYKRLQLEHALIEAYAQNLMNNVKRAVVIREESRRLGVAKFVFNTITLACSNVLRPIIRKKHEKLQRVQQRLKVTSRFKSLKDNSNESTRGGSSGIGSGFMNREPSLRNFSSIRREVSSDHSGLIHRSDSSAGEEDIGSGLEDNNSNDHASASHKDGMEGEDVSSGGGGSGVTVQRQDTFGDAFTAASSNGDNNDKLEVMLKMAMKIASEEEAEVHRRRMAELKELHKQKQEAMERERQRRLVMIEQERIKREKDAYLKKIEDERLRLERERIQKETQERLESERREQIRINARLKEERKRREADMMALRAVERAREEEECKLMKEEEKRVVLENWHRKAAESRRKQLALLPKEDRDSKPVLPQKRPPVPRLATLLAHPEEDEETRQRRLAAAAAKAEAKRREEEERSRREEEEAAEARRKAHEQLIASRIALQQRVAARVAEDHERRRKEEEEQHKKQEERDRLAVEAQKRVQRAVKRSKRGKVKRKPGQHRNGGREGGPLLPKDRRGDKNNNNNKSESHHDGAGGDGEEDNDNDDDEEEDYDDEEDYVYDEDEDDHRGAVHLSLVPPLDPSFMGFSPPGKDAATKPILLVNEEDHDDDDDDEDPLMDPLADSFDEYPPPPMPGHDGKLAKFSHLHGPKGVIGATHWDWNGVDIHDNNSPSKKKKTGKNISDGQKKKHKSKESGSDKKTKSKNKGKDHESDDKGMSKMKAEWNDSTHAVLISNKGNDNKKDGKVNALHAIVSRARIKLSDNHQEHDDDNCGILDHPVIALNDGHTRRSYSMDGADLIQVSLAAPKAHHASKKRTIEDLKGEKYHLPPLAPLRAPVIAAPTMYQSRSGGSDGLSLPLVAKAAGQRRSADKISSRVSTEGLSSAAGRVNGSSGGGNGIGEKGNQSQYAAKQSHGLSNEFLGSTIKTNSMSAAAGKTPADFEKLLDDECELLFSRFANKLGSAHVPPRRSSLQLSSRVGEDEEHSSQSGSGSGSGSGVGSGVGIGSGSGSGESMVNNVGETTAISTTTATATATGSRSKSRRSSIASDDMDGSRKMSFTRRRSSATHSRRSSTSMSISDERSYSDDFDEYPEEEEEEFDNDNNVNNRNSSSNIKSNGNVVDNEADVDMNKKFISQMNSILSQVQEQRQSQLESETSLQQRDQLDSPSVMPKGSSSSKVISVTESNQSVVNKFNTLVWDPLSDVCTSNDEEDNREESDEEDDDNGDVGNEERGDAQLEDERDMMLMKEDSSDSDSDNDDNSRGGGEFRPERQSVGNNDNDIDNGEKELPHDNNEEADDEDKDKDEVEEGVEVEEEDDDDGKSEEDEEDEGEGDRSGSYGGNNVNTRVGEEDSGNVGEGDNDDDDDDGDNSAVDNRVHENLEALHSGSKEYSADITTTRSSIHKSYVDYSDDDDDDGDDDSEDGHDPEEESFLREELDRLRQKLNSSKSTPAIIRVSDPSVVK
eukprot:gene2986-5858_t